jgi:hypothetical protein
MPIEDGDPITVCIPQMSRGISINSKDALTVRAEDCASDALVWTSEDSNLFSLYIPQTRGAII